MKMSIASMMKPLPLLFMGLFAASPSAFAGQKILLETPVKVSADVGVSDKVNQECELGDMLARRVGPALNVVNKPRKEKRKAKDKGKAEQEASSKSEPAPAVLRVQVVEVNGAGAEEETSPKEAKSITVAAEILDKGKVLRKTRLTRSNGGNLLSRFKSTCSILDGAATSIAKELGQWAADATYQVPEESAAKGKSKGKGKPIENTIPAEASSK